MRNLIVAFAACVVAFSASAETLRATNGQDSIRLYDTPCVNLAVLKLAHPSWHADLSKATAMVDGQPFEACWAPWNDSAKVLYEDGDQGLIPLADFKQDDGI